MRKLFSIAFAWMALVPTAGLNFAAAEEKNLLENPSFEITKDKDQFGWVFPKWGGWKYEGDCDFRVGQIAHSGKHSCLLVRRRGAQDPHRAERSTCRPGRYKITAYLRGLDIGAGIWNSNTEFMFADKYFPLKKNGTFGWTKLTYVADLGEKKQAGPSFGLMAPGYFWIDDVSLVKVGNDVPLTAEPVLGTEEAAIAPPGEFGPGARSAARNAATRTCRPGRPVMPAARRWKSSTRRPPAPATKRSPRSRTRTPSRTAPWSRRTPPTAARPCGSTSSYAVMLQPQDWLGYDFLKADFYTDSKDPLSLYVEIHDAGTRGYWDRVNYNTVVPPGRSTLVVPVKQLYVGEKSRPGRMLNLGGITRLVLAIDDKPPAPLFIDNLRLERDDSPAAGDLRRPVCLRLRPRHQPGDGRLHADHPGHALQQGPRLRPEERQGLAELRRPAARSALPGLHLHRVGRPGRRRAQRQVPRAS